MILKFLKMRILYRMQPNDLLQHVAIKNPLAVPRAAAAPPKIAPGVQMVKEVKKEVTRDFRLFCLCFDCRRMKLMNHLHNR